MDATTEAEYAAGFDLIPRTKVATCRTCPCVMAGTALPACCPGCGQPWGQYDADEIKADPELRRLAGDFRLPEDDERRRLDAGAAARFERRDEA